MKQGDAVIYVDSLRVEHPALLTAVWDNNGQIENPSVNLVYVSGDETKSDSYGRQIERVTSNVHISQNSAGANCWKRVGE